MTGMYTAPDGRGRIFVTEQAGRIMVFDAASSSPQATTFLDITDRVDSSSQEMFGRPRGLRAEAYSCVHGGR
jgi:hypothetical protein